MSEAKVFDIEDLEAMKVRTFDLVVGRRDPSDADPAGAPVGFKVVGASSAEFQRAQRAHEILSTKLAAQRGVPLDAKTDDGAETLVASGESRRNLIVSECVVDWFGFTVGRTEPFAFSKDNLERVLRAKPEWRDALFLAITNEANFTPG